MKCEICQGRGQTGEMTKVSESLQHFEELDRFRPNGLPLISVWECSWGHRKTWTEVEFEQLNVLTWDLKGF